MDLNQDASPNLPASPSRSVMKILHILDLNKSGVKLAPVAWRKLKLYSYEYQELLGCIKADASLQEFVEQEIRYDYTAKSSTLTYRELIPFHTVFLNHITREISRWLAILSKDTTDPVGRYARCVRFADTALNLSGEEDQLTSKFKRRHPDASFWHRVAPWPGLVIELSHPAKRQLMSKLANDYISETAGEIRVVVGVEIDPECQVGAISMWRPKSVGMDGESKFGAKLEVASHVFRDEYGQANTAPDAGLQIYLRDFAGERFSDGLEDEFLLIPAATLTRFLHEAEEQDHRREQRGRNIERRPSEMEEEPRKPKESIMLRFPNYRHSNQIDEEQVNDGYVADESSPEESSPDKSSPVDSFHKENDNSPHRSSPDATSTEGSSPNGSTPAGSPPAGSRAPTNSPLDGSQSPKEDAEEA